MRKSIRTCSRFHRLPLALKSALFKVPIAPFTSSIVACVQQDTTEERMDSDAVVTAENQQFYAIQSGSAAGADPRAGFRGGNATGSSPIKRRKLVFSKRLVAQKGWKVPKDPPAAATKVKTEDDGRFCLLNKRLAAVEGALATVNTKIDSVGALAGQFDGFAAAIAADKARTQELFAALADNHRKDLEVLDAILQAKLSIIENTFSKCDSALKELQQAAFTAAAAGPAPPDGPATAALRRRADELALEQLRQADQLRNVEEMIIAERRN